MGQVFKVDGIHLNLKEPTKHRVEWSNTGGNEEALGCMHEKKRNKVAETEDRGRQA